MNPTVWSDARILQSPTWVETVRALPFLPEAGLSRGRRLRTALLNSRLVLRSVKEGDILIFGNDSPTSATLYCLLAAMRNQRPVVVRSDPLLRYPRSPLKKMLVCLSMQAVDKLLVWAPTVVERYHSVYGIPKHKMLAIPFHHSLAGYQIEPSQGNYVFSGGNSARDYTTLLRAVHDLDIPFTVCTGLKISENVPAHVSVRTVSPGEFRQLMAQARFVVLPLDMTDLRTTGQQSYLNAMAMGKLVIVTDTVDAPFHIENGVTGILTPSRDVDALREAIIWAWQNPGEAERIGHRAKEVAAPMDTEWWCKQVLEVAYQLHAERKGTR